MMVLPSLLALSLLYRPSRICSGGLVIRVHARENDLRVQIMFNNIIRHVFNLLNFKLNVMRCASGDRRSYETSTMCLWYLRVFVYKTVCKSLRFVWNQKSFVIKLNVNLLRTVLMWME